MTHRTPLGRLHDKTKVRSEILDAQAALGDLAHPDRLFRPFGGGGALGPHLLNQEALAVLREQKMTCVLWNAIPRDWKDPHGWVARALEQCQAQARTLLVLHDLPTGAMTHLPAFIAALRARGGQFDQAFPADCVPIRCGEAVQDLAPYVNGGSC